MSKEINNLKVTKASGSIEPFLIDKLKNSLERANATTDEINTIVETILPKLYNGISTQKIYTEAFRLLRKRSKNNAARFHLKKGIMELGPSGFPFEKLIGEVFKHQGFTVQVGTVLQGKCVTHEIDVIAEKENQLNLMECKYRNQPGIAVDVKTPLYIYSRFQDVLANEFLGYKEKTFTGWVITNSKFTSDSIAYSNCKGMKLLSWDYPLNNSLKDLIDRTGLYPLTCLTSLTRSEKEWLLSKGYVLVKSILNDEKLLLKAGVKAIRMKTVIEEGTKLLQS